jgi:hypothetical protein
MSYALADEKRTVGLPRKIKLFILFYEVKGNVLFFMEI